MNEEFLNQTTLLKYSTDKFEKQKFSNLADISFADKDGSIKWLNTYGIRYQPEFIKIIEQNGLDDFLIKLMMEEEHPNKVIVLKDLLFVAFEF